MIYRFACVFTVGLVSIGLNLNVLLAFQSDDNLLKGFKAVNMVQDLQVGSSMILKELNLSPEQIESLKRLNKDWSRDYIEALNRGIDPDVAEKIFDEFQAKNAPNFLDRIRKILGPENSFRLNQLFNQREFVQASKIEVDWYGLGDPRLQRVLNISEKQKQKFVEASDDVYSEIKEMKQQTATAFTKASQDFRKKMLSVLNAGQKSKFESWFGEDPVWSFCKDSADWKKLMRQYSQGGNLQVRTRTFPKVEKPKDPIKLEMLWFSLVKNTHLMRELDFTKDQEKKLNQLLEKHSQNLILVQTPGGRIVEILEGKPPEIHKEFAKLFLRHQLSTIRQLELQLLTINCWSSFGLLHSHVAGKKGLNLTDEQKTKLKKLSTEFESYLAQMRQETEHGISKIFAGRRSKLFESLTTGQKSRYNLYFGEPAKFRVKRFLTWDLEVDKVARDEGGLKR